MANKKAIYKVDNGTDYDEIHFKTVAEQVVLNNGKSVQEEDENNFKKDGGDIIGAVNIRQSKTSILVLEEGVPLIIGNPNKNDIEGSVEMGNGLIKKWLTFDFEVTRSGNFNTNKRFKTPFPNMAIEASAFIIRNKTTGDDRDIANFDISALGRTDRAGVYLKYDGPTHPNPEESVVFEVRVAVTGF